MSNATTSGPKLHGLSRFQQKRVEAPVIPKSVFDLLNPVPIKFHSDTKHHFIKIKVKKISKCAKLARRKNR